MHAEARAGLASMLESAGMDDQWQGRVLDLGGRDINGGIRDLLPGADWVGVDIEPGPGVDIVRDCTTGWLDILPTFDAVVCTEVLEHVEKWPDLVRTCHQALRSGGSLFITCASTGRRAHGASGAMWPAPGEWYRNVPDHELADVLGDLFHFSSITFNPSPGDLYAWANDIEEPE